MCLCTCFFIILWLNDQDNIEHPSNLSVSCWLFLKFLSKRLSISVLICVTVSLLFKNEEKEEEKSSLLGSHLMSHLKFSNWPPWKFLKNKETVKKQKRSGTSAVTLEETIQEKNQGFWSLRTLVTLKFNGTLFLVFKWLMKNCGTPKETDETFFSHHLIRLPTQHWNLGKLSSIFVILSKNQDYHGISKCSPWFIFLKKQHHTRTTLTRSGLHFRSFWTLEFITIFLIFKNTNKHISSLSFYVLVNAVVHFSLISRYRTLK